MALLVCYVMVSPDQEDPPIWGNALLSEDIFMSKDAHSSQIVLREKVRDYHERVVGWVVSKKPREAVIVNVMKIPGDLQ